MGLWVRDGATPWQTLVAATRHGAAVCGVGAELGTVEVGKLADLIVVGANPLEDIMSARGHHECPPPAASPKRGPDSFGQAASEWRDLMTRGAIVDRCNSGRLTDQPAVHGHTNNRFRRISSALCVPAEVC